MRKHICVGYIILYAADDINKDTLLGHVDKARFKRRTLHVPNLMKWEKSIVFAQFIDELEMFAEDHTESIAGWQFRNLYFAVGLR